MDWRKFFDMKARTLEMCCPDIRENPDEYRYVVARRLVESVGDAKLEELNRDYKAWREWRNTQLPSLSAVVLRDKDMRDYAELKTGVRLPDGR